MQLFHGGPFNPSCDPDATGKGAPHGLGKAVALLSIVMKTSYEFTAGKQNAAHAALFSNGVHGN
jgi:hypothetical protein